MSNLRLAGQHYSPMTGSVFEHGNRQSSERQIEHTHTSTKIVGTL